MNKNKNYVRGRAFEYKIAALMRRKGYFVVRAAGSRGVSDLVAMKKGVMPLLIQCKIGAMSGLNADEHNALLNTAISSGGVPILAFKPEKGPILFFVLTGIREKPGENEKGDKTQMNEKEFTERYSEEAFKEEQSRRWELAEELPRAVIAE